jgi:hypothetical protein
MIAPATVTSNASLGLTVSVTRCCHQSENGPTWAVIVADSTNIVLLRKFTTVHCALAFASEALKRHAS